MGRGPIRFSLLLAGLVGAAPMAAARDADTADGGNDADPADILNRASPSDIVVFGRRDDGTIEGVAAEDELGEGDIAGYGRETVGDLIEDLGRAVDAGDEGPVVLVDGQPASGMADIASLPSEAVRRIQLLPRQSAARFGQRPDRRVVNVVLKRNFRQAALSAEGGLATAGGARTARAEASYTHIAGGDRVNLSLRFVDADALRESRRGILTETAGGVAYDLVGNVLPSPLSRSEIDPGLSALAGTPVAVAAVPAGTARPTLAAFLPGAGRAATSDLGDYRTLTPQSRSWSATGSFSHRYGPRTTLSGNLRGEVGTSRSLVGAMGVLLRLPAGSPYSPFVEEVTIARYLGAPLEQERRFGTLSAGLTLNAPVGSWRSTVLASYAHRHSRTATDRSRDLVALQSAVAVGAQSPFGPLPEALLGALNQDRAQSWGDRSSIQAVFTGRLFSLPAGPVTAAFRIGAGTDRLRSSGTVNGALRRSGYRRDEANAQAGIEVPVSSPARGGLGMLTLLASASARQAGGVGTLGNYSGGLRWQPVAGLTLTGSIEREENPPSPQLLSDPVIATANVRIYDFLRDETVAVTLVTGGNPDLAVERRRLLRLGVSYRPIARADLDLRGEYVRSRGRNVVSALPPVSAEVQAAFGDRYQRDASGRLVLVDARAVGFSRDDRQQVRWGMTWRGKIGGGRLAGRDDAAGGDDDEPPASAPRGGLRGVMSGVRFNLSATHTWTLESVRQARPGLAVIDMLRGGASGYGSGQPRHTVDFEAGVIGGGLGLKAEGTWNSATKVRAGVAASPSDLRFAPRAVVNLRAWADLGLLAPDKRWLDRVRVTVSADNVFDSRQVVTDGSGATPLRYQPYLLDPTGREIRVTLRKAF